MNLLGSTILKSACPLLVASLDVKTDALVFTDDWVSGRGRARHDDCACLCVRVCMCRVFRQMDVTP